MSTLTDQLRTAVADAKRFDANSIAFEPRVVTAFLQALEHRDETIRHQDDAMRALKRRIQVVLDSDVMTVLTKLQNIERIVTR